MISVVVTGFIVGVLIGLTGMGGGLLMTPLLVLLYGLPPTMAVGTDLVYAAVTKAVGSWQYFYQKTVKWDIVKKLIAGSCPGAITGVLCIQILKNHTRWPVEDLLGKLLGFTFVFVSILMLVQIMYRNRKKMNFLTRIPLGGAGFFGGLMVGITSVGSGSLFMVFLLTSTSLPASLLVGTDVVHAFFLTLTAGFLYASLGHVDLSFVMWLLIGSIPGILVGGRLTLKVPELFLRVLIIVVLLFTGMKMI